MTAAMGGRGRAETPEIVVDAAETNDRQAC